MLTSQILITYNLIKMIEMNKSNDNDVPQIIKRKSEKKVKINRYLCNFIKRLEELRILEIKRINAFLK
ncbi:MAG: hypothetical protein D0530_00540 [Methylococcales bacterium]|nr:MAG: hypothetical protein D0530_00540 [Methylococcales bacterium]